MGINPLRRRAWEPEPKRRSALRTRNCGDLPALGEDAVKRRGGASAESPLVVEGFYFGGGVI